MVLLLLLWAPPQQIVRINEMGSIWSDRVNDYQWYLPRIGKGFSTNRRPVFRHVVLAGPIGCRPEKSVWRRDWALWMLGIKFQFCLYQRLSIFTFFSINKWAQLKIFEWFTKKMFQYSVLKIFQSVTELALVWSRYISLTSCLFYNPSPIIFDYLRLFVLFYMNECISSLVFVLYRKYFIPLMRETLVVIILVIKMFVVFNVCC